jgi:hypothetical protein
VEKTVVSWSDRGLNPSRPRRRFLRDQQTEDDDDHDDEDEEDWNATLKRYFNQVSTLGTLRLGDAP